MDLNLLDLHEIKETTLSNLRASFAMIHQNYKENSEKSTRKIELYSKKWVPVKFLMKYPLSLLLFIIIFTSFVLFFRSQKRNMMRVFTKNLSI